MFLARSILLLASVTLSVALMPSAARGAQLDLNWVDHSDGQASFVIQRSVNGTGTSAQYTTIAQVAVGVTSYSDTTVSPGSTYCYQVAGVEGNEMSPFSRVACAKPGGGGLSLAVTKTGAAQGTIVSNPPGIDCGATCSYTYPAGKMVTLTAMPAPGSTFSGWSRGCSGTAPCTMVGNVSMTVTAIFAILPAKTGMALPGSFGKDATK